MKIGPRIKNLRLKKGLARGELGERTSLSPSAQQACRANKKKAGAHAPRLELTMVSTYKHQGLC